jgi:hypothetical protein
VCGRNRHFAREVWVDEKGEVVRYNLALILPHVFGADKSRILGYDNAHGTHERHYMGQVQTVRFKNYLTTATRFFREAAAIRRKYED